MSETKHTPAPWVATEFAGVRGPTVSARMADEEWAALWEVVRYHDRVYAPPPDPLQRLGHEARRARESEAALLEALRDAVALFDGLVREGLLGGSAEAEAEFAENTAPLRAAIAKAEAAP